MLNRYYEDELIKLRTLAAEFSKANPALAPMLSGVSADPDVERLLEGVAFLTGMARQKLDDEFPEFVQEIANLLFPHFLRPVPSTSMVAFAPRGAQMETVAIPAGTELGSLPVDGTPCVFRTTQDVEAVPVVLQNAGLSAEVGLPPTLSFDFVSPGVDVSQLTISKLRLFLSGGYSEAAKLMLLLCKYVQAVQLECGTQVIDLGLGGLRASGFDNALLDYPGNAFPGYRVLQEFYVQPEKFLFVDIEGLDGLRNCGKINRFRIVCRLSQVPSWISGIKTSDFMLNVTPVINLFSRSAEPISHEHRVSEYRVVPEAQERDHYRVFSVDHVIGYQQGVAQQRPYQPFGQIGTDGLLAKRTFRTTIRPAAIGAGTDTYMSLTYPPEDELIPETLSISLTCTNHNLPVSLKIGDISQPTASSPDRMSFSNIRPLTAPLDPPLGETLLWRLISHVSLNFLSLADANNLRTLLGIYIFSERNEISLDAANRRRIDGIQSVEVTRDTRLVGRGSLMRGQRIVLKCRLDYYAGEGDMFMFGSVVERFLANYAPINSYTRVEMVDVFSGVSFQWPPRLGNQVLL